eukprot:scpid53079/ scgid6273/ 
MADQSSSGSFSQGHSSFSQSSTNQITSGDDSLLAASRPQLISPSSGSFQGSSGVLRLHQASGSTSRLPRLAGAGRPKAPMDNVDESLSSVGDSLGSIMSPDARRPGAGPHMTSTPRRPSPSPVRTKDMDILRREMETLRETQRRLYANLEVRTQELKHREVEHAKTKEELASLRMETDKLVKKEYLKLQAVEDDQPVQMEQLIDQLSCYRTELAAAKTIFAEKDQMIEQLKEKMTSTEIMCEKIRDDQRSEIARSADTQQRLAEMTENFKKSLHSARQAEGEVEHLNAIVQELRRSQEDCLAQEKRAKDEARQCLKRLNGEEVKIKQLQRREKELNEEKDQLKAWGSRLKEERSAAVDRAVSKAGSEHQERITDLLAELSKLQQENLEKDCALDRLRNDHRTLEKDLEKAKRRPEQLISEHTLAELRQRLTSVEGSRDEAMLEANLQCDAVKQMAAKLEHQQITSSRQVAHFEDLLEKADKKIDDLHAREQDLQASKKILTSQLQTAENRHQELDQKWKDKMAGLEQMLKIKDVELLAQVENTTAYSRKCIIELREQVRVHQRFGVKCRASELAMAEKRKEAEDRLGKLVQKGHDEKCHLLEEIESTKEAMATNLQRMNRLLAERGRLQEDLAFSREQESSTRTNLMQMVKEMQDLTEEKRQLALALHAYQVAPGKNQSENILFPSTYSAARLNALKGRFQASDTGIANRTTTPVHAPGRQGRQPSASHVAPAARPAPRATNPSIRRESPAPGAGSRDNSSISSS